MRFLLLFLLCLSFLLNAEKISASSVKPQVHTNLPNEILIGGDQREIPEDRGEGDALDNTPGGGSDSGEGDALDNTPGNGGGVVEDACGGCGIHGVCDEATLTCVCLDEYYGPMCSLRDCGAHGAYSRLTESCVCQPGYFGALCDECGGAPEGEKFMCMGKGDRYRIVAFNAYEAKGFANLVALGFDFFEPGTNPEFDCSCKHLESAALRRPARIPFRDLSEQEILEAFNAISVEAIDAEQTTSQELSDIVRRNNRDRNDCKFETILPILILGLIATVVLALISIVVVVWALYMSRPRKQKN